MLPSKILAIRRFRRGFALLAGLVVLNAALLIAGDPIAQCRMVRDTGEVNPGTDPVAAEDETDRAQSLAQVAANGLTPTPSGKLQSLAENGLSSQTAPATR
jgi:hypothetical protein